MSYSPEHVELAAAVQARLEEVLLELAGWLHRRTGERRLTMAGGVALNCVANTGLAADGPFDELWVQPASGDAGTALGGALHLAQQLGDHIAPMPGADLGRGFTGDELTRWLDDAHLRYERPPDVAAPAAEALADDAIVAWFQGPQRVRPARWVTCRCSRTPGKPGTSTGSMRSRAASSSARGADGARRAGR